MRFTLLISTLLFAFVAWVAVSPVARSFTFASVSPSHRAAPVETPAMKAMAFMLDAPAQTNLKKPLELWATWYHMPSVKSVAATAPQAAPLIGRDGEAISMPVSASDWCDAALQGSVWIEGPGGEKTAYVYVDDKGPVQQDCDARLGDLGDGVKHATRRARFASFRHPAGCDARPLPLLPFRTVAVDTKVVPLRTVLYVPELRGQLFMLDGKVFAHDGYVFASDRGGAIEGNHIDVFVQQETEDEAPLPSVIRSSPKGTFKAFPVSPKDPAVKALIASHELVCSPGWTGRPGDTRQADGRAYAQGPA